jgi:hypothetical protein
MFKVAAWSFLAWIPVIGFEGDGNAVIVVARAMRMLRTRMNCILNEMLRMK